MPKPKLSIEQRAKRYNKDGLYIIDLKNKIMMCRHCNIRVDWTKKSVLIKHVESENHKLHIPQSVASQKQVEKETIIDVDSELNESICIPKSSISANGGAKRLCCISTALEAATTTSVKQEREDFARTVTKTCLKANIEIEKLDHEAIREFLNKYIKGIF